MKTSQLDAKRFGGEPLPATAPALQERADSGRLLPALTATHGLGGRGAARQSHGSGLGGAGAESHSCEFIGCMLSLHD